MNGLDLKDNDSGEIIVTFHGQEMRNWSYNSDDERRLKMRCAREYCEGWHDAAEEGSYDHFNRYIAGDR